MVQESALSIAEIEFFGDIRHNHHGKFQPLAAMDAHNLYHVFTGTQGTGHRQIRITLLEIFNKAQKAEQPPVIAALKVSGPVGQHAQVCLPQQAAL